MARPGHDQGCAGYDLTHLHAVMLTLYGSVYWAMLSEWPPATFLFMCLTMSIKQNSEVFWLDRRNLEMRQPVLDS